MKYGHDFDHTPFVKTPNGSIEISADQNNMGFTAHYRALSFMTRQMMIEDMKASLSGIEKRFSDIAVEMPENFFELMNYKVRVHTFLTKKDRQFEGLEVGNTAVY